MPTIVGHQTGDIFEWTSTIYTPVLSYRFLTPFPVDTFCDGYRISPILDVVSPDSFLVTACYGDGSTISRSVMTDTLMLQMTGNDLDSVILRSFYENNIDDSGLTLIYNARNRMPITSKICGGSQYDLSPTCELLVTNNEAAPNNIALGNDPQIMTCQAPAIALAGHETKNIPFTTMIGNGDSGNIIITIRDSAGDYYPHLAKASYPFDEPTDIDSESPGDASIANNDF